MACSWLYLASRNSPERFCDKPGHPYCPEHQREMDAMEKSDKDWDEILATYEVVCEEPQRTDGEPSTTTDDETDLSP